MPSITKSLAIAIYKKLGTAPTSKDLPTLVVSVHPGKKHQIVQVLCNGNWVAQFGIKNGSKMEAGHGWIPAQLFLSSNDIFQFGKCKKSIDWLLEEWQKLDKIPA